MKTTTGKMKICSETVTLSTKGFCDILDITNLVTKLLIDSNILEGQALVFVPGATAGITTIEYEPGLLKDLPTFFEKIIPSNIKYKHDLTWNDGNGFSHLRSALLKSSLNVPITEKCLVLGTWQQIVLIDFDNRPRDRKIFIQISGTE